MAKTQAHLQMLGGLSSMKKTGGMERKGRAALSLGRMEMKGLPEQGKKGSPWKGRRQRKQERKGLDIDGTGG